MDVVSKEVRAHGNENRMKRDGGRTGEEMEMRLAGCGWAAGG